MVWLIQLHKNNFKGKSMKVTTKVIIIDLKKEIAKTVVLTGDFELKKHRKGTLGHCHT